ncbi:hypothetical protein J6590_014484 [Homalodisca vitripennis]|nr:hypothetical protein J6590_014484 [Homalodisca vitripennis]
MSDQLLDYLEKNQLLDSFQHGFRKGKYTNVLVPWWLLQERCWEPLQTQRMATAHFPLPTLRQLRDRICAVCLDDMRLLSARVTPCHHVLHAYCLRKTGERARERFHASLTRSKPWHDCDSEQRTPGSSVVPDATSANSCLFTTQ